MMEIKSVYDFDLIPTPTLKRDSLIANGSGSDAEKDAISILEACRDKIGKAKECYVSIELSKHFSSDAVNLAVAVLENRGWNVLHNKAFKTLTLEPQPGK